MVGINSPNADMDCILTYFWVNTDRRDQGNACNQDSDEKSFVHFEVVVVLGKAGMSKICLFVVLEVIFMYKACWGCEIQKDEGVFIAQLSQD